jgi:hypothetical protein
LIREKEMRSELTVAAVIAALLMLPLQPAAQPSGKSPTGPGASATPSQTEAEVNLVWRSFLAAVRSGDVAKATTHVHPSSPLAAQLRQSFPQVAKHLANVRNEIAVSAVYGPIAECDMIVQGPDGGNRFYPISFIRGGQAWQIKSM